MDRLMGGWRSVKNIWRRGSDGRSYILSFYLKISGCLVRLFCSFYRMRWYGVKEGRGRGEGGA